MILEYGFNQRNVVETDYKEWRKSIKRRTFLYPRLTPEPSAITGQHCPFPRPIRKPYPTRTLKEKPGA